MSYLRVCPRDLFNEADLLKCLGRISLLIHDNTLRGINMNHEDERRGFQIEMNDNDGAISVSNLHFFDDNGTPIYFYRPLNARSKWPLMMSYKEEEYFVFKGDGKICFDVNKFIKETKGKK